MTKAKENTEVQGTDGFDFDQLEKTQDSQMVEFTSNLLKMEEGEVVNGLLQHFDQNETLTGENDEPYACAVLRTKNGKVLIADAVVMSTQERLFRHPQHSNKTEIPVRITCLGMVKSSTSNNKYRAFKILALTT